MRIVTLLVVLAPLVFAIPTSYAADAPEECAANFSVSGSFFA
jgi:hypothetical protein